MAMALKFKFVNNDKVGPIYTSACETPLDKTLPEPLPPLDQPSTTPPLDF